MKKTTGALMALCARAKSWLPQQPHFLQNHHFPAVYSMSPPHLSERSVVHVGSWALRGWPTPRRHGSLFTRFSTSLIGSRCDAFPLMHSLHALQLLFEVSPVCGVSAQPGSA